ncbi:MAG: DUF4878 domain-containing protein [Acidobacteria bacterium]|nr:DUF4878 domain-containing protein [Acidobacteriota bacterium]
MNSSSTKAFFLIIALFGMLACSPGESKPESPIETFKTYTKAIKNKDITTMKLLLSKDSMRMNEMEAKSRGIPVDDVVKNETLFSENQRTVKMRNEKIDGDKATLEVENSFGAWETVPFIKEDGVWKLDKKGYQQRLIDEVNQGGQQLDDIINQSRQPQTATPEQPQP